LKYLQSFSHDGCVHRPETNQGGMMNFRVSRCALSLLIVHTISCAVVVPYVSLRSQGINGARELVGWQATINRFDVGKCYASFSVTPEYTRSFHAQRMAQWLFADAITPWCAPQGEHHPCMGIKIQGTGIQQRDPQALMAENFYLPYDYDSVVTFNPVIENILLDINAYVGLDNLHDGLFFRIHSPLCRTCWNLNMREHVNHAGQSAYDVGYIDSTFASTFTCPTVHGLERNHMLASFTQYISTCASLYNHDGIAYHGLHNARISTRARTKIAFAELTAQLGWNFCSGPDYHCGLALRVAAPTGNRPEGRWLFEPIVGNGHHWELGGSLTSHWCVWKNLSETLHIYAYLDANVTHLFSTRQYRTFDLWKNPLSRYMLALKFTQDTQDLKVHSDTTTPIDYAPAVQGARDLTPLANITTLPVDVSATVQGELVLQCALAYKNITCDLGYNFWGRTCLKIYRSCCNRDGHVDFVDHAYGLKGDSYIFGFPLITNQNQLIDVQQPGIPLSATQYHATIFNGCNNFYTQTWTNPGIDSPKEAYDNALNNLGTKPNNTHNPTIPPYGWDNVKTSATPRTLTYDDLDINSARTRGLSHKIFAHVNYIWSRGFNITPYIGFGLEVEYGQKNDHCIRRHAKAQPRVHCTTPPPVPSCYTHDNHTSPGPECATVSLSQWGLWVKSGISFD
jgi:hypothetical protein